MTTADTGSYGWSRCPSCRRRLDHLLEGRPDCPNCTPPGLLGTSVNPLVPADTTNLGTIICDHCGRSDFASEIGLAAHTRSAHPESAV